MCPKADFKVEVQSRIILNFNLPLQTLSPPPPKCWDDRHSPQPIHGGLRLDPSSSCMLGKTSELKDNVNIY